MIGEKVYSAFYAQASDSTELDLDHSSSGAYFPFHSPTA